MEPIDLLFAEHKVILKLIENLKIYKKNLALRKDRELILEEIVDFLRIYADQSHHGKEENILFKKLKDKPLKKEEKLILSELFKEHEEARKLVAKLDELKFSKDFSLIEKVIDEMVTLYEKHIAKENRKFFIPVFSYFSLEEKKEIYAEFIEVDHEILNAKYANVLTSIEQKIQNCL